MDVFKTLHYFDLGLALSEAKHVYQARCQRALNHSPRPWLIMGPSFIPDNHFNWLNIKAPYFQDPMLAYLTGINQAHTALLLIPKKRSIILFLPKHNDEIARWEGDFFGISDTTRSLYIEHFGLSKLYDIKDIKKQIPLLLKDTATLGLSECSVTAHPCSKTFKRKLRSWLPRSCTLSDHSQIELKQRLVIDKVALKIVEKTIAMSKKAFYKALDSLSYAKTENEVYAALAGSIVAQSPYGASFPAIVASSKQATCLHYTDNNQKLDSDGMILIDFGVRWQAYVSDITRTIPVTGQFHPIDKVLYQCVLTTQQYVESLVKPGITMAWLNEQCWNYLNKLLKQNVLEKGWSIKTGYTHAPHKVGHFIGIAVHDGDHKRHYQQRPLSVGQMITNEPGFYGSVTAQYNNNTCVRDIGIRIEDMLLITDTGCVNLSSSIPKAC